MDTGNRGPAPLQPQAEREDDPVPVWGSQPFVRGDPDAEVHGSYVERNQIDLEAGS